MAAKKEILVMHPSGEIGDYIWEAARKLEIPVIRLDRRKSSAGEVSLGLSDEEIILKPRKPDEAEKYVSQKIGALKKDLKRKACFVAEDNEIDPLWYISFLDDYEFRQRDDLVIFAMNQVLFKDLLTYAKNRGCEIPHPEFQILDINNETEPAKKLMEFMQEHQGGLVYPEITAFCHGVTRILGEDADHLDEIGAQSAIETALHAGSVRTDRGKIVLEAWIPDIVAELFLILCYDRKKFLRCPPIIYRKEFFEGAEAKFVYATVESRTSPSLRYWMSDAVSKCYDISEQLLQFIYEYMDELRDVVYDRFTYPCPPLSNTYGFFSLKWFITRDGRSFLKELNVTPRDMGFVAEPIRGEQVWSKSPSELYLDRILGNRLPKEVIPYRDASMRFICGDKDAGQISFASSVNDSQYAQTDIRLYRQKTYVYPGRHMGQIRVAEGDNVWNEKIIEEILQQIEIREIR